MQSGKIYGTRTKICESWFFQGWCPVKAQSVSKLGYFQSVWNTHWKIWAIHKVLAVTFDLEEQLECFSMKCFSLVLQKLEHWPTVGDIHLPLSTLLNGTDAHLPLLQQNTQWWCLKEDEPFISYLALPGRVGKSTRSVDLKTLRKNWLCSLVAGIHMKEQQFFLLPKIKRKIKMKIRNGRKTFRGQWAQLWIGKNFSAPCVPVTPLGVQDQACQQQFHPLIREILKRYLSKSCCQLWFMTFDTVGKWTESEIYLMLYNKPWG